MLEATGFLAAEGIRHPPGVHLLPSEGQDRAAEHLLGESLKIYCKSFLRPSSRYSAVTELSGE